jgi:hypothetical protein
MLRKPPHILVTTPESLYLLRMLDLEIEVPRRKNFPTKRSWHAPTGSNRNGAKSRPYSHGRRWTLFPGNVAQASSLPVNESPDRVEHWAWQLLSRYGIMFRDLLARESVAPPWKSLLPVYRRLEARGEIRGGRFVHGVAGEQFAVPEAVESLRRVRDQKANGDWLVLSACDPVNLFGILTMAYAFLLFGRI